MKNLDRFMRLFRGYTKRHGRYVVEHQEESGKYTGKARTVDLTPTEDDFEFHLKGERGIGIIPLTEEDKCYFAAIDIDIYPVDHLSVAWAVRKMPLFVTRSKSNGAHVWLFIPNGASAQVVVRYMKKVAGELGYGGCEIFPKQTRRASVHDVGNWINLPYFGDSRVGVAIKSEDDKELIEYTLDDWVDFVCSNIESVTEEQLVERAPKVTGTRSGKATKEDWIDGPPCLERIGAAGLQEGSRNDVMYQAVTYLARKYASTEEVETRAVAWNHKVYNPPLGVSEIRGVVKSVTGKERGFICNRSPMVDSCDRATCLRRAFGVGSAATDLPFEIGGFSKILSVPPMYAFNVDGKRVKLPNVRALSNQKEFRNYIMDAISKVMPFFAQSKYDDLLAGWLKNCEDVELAPDADHRLQWADMLSEFIENNQHDSRERLVKGHAWIDEEGKVAYFQMSDYKKYLSKNRVQFIDAQLMDYLEETMRVAFHKRGTTVAKTSVRLYSVPLSKLHFTDASEPTIEGEVM